MRQDNRTINGLWIGSQLSLMEKLTLRSFVGNGHRFVLWVYGDLDCEMPQGAELHDAKQIIPAKHVFRYQGGTYPGSYAGFADMFRYALLYELGGWWVDMDVACLKPFDLDATFAFRPIPIAGVINNILKCPPRHRLMGLSYRWTRRFVGENNLHWLLPNKPLQIGIQRYGLQQYFVNPKWFATDRPSDWMPFLINSDCLPSNERMAIHWCNEWSRSKGFDKEQPTAGSYYWKLLIQYGLIDG